MAECVEPIVGKILAGWRYDISGLAPEMCADYEQHFAECERCRTRQKIHRIIDISLIGLASASAATFLIAFAAIRYLTRAMPSGLNSALSPASLYLRSCGWLSPWPPLLLWPL